MYELMSEFYPQLSLRIVYFGSNTIGNQFNLKFRNRIREHQGLTVRTGKRCAEGCEVFSEIRSHCHGHKIHVNPDNFEIIAKLRNESHLERLESLYQRTLKPKIINQCQSIPLLTFSN